MSDQPDKDSVIAIRDIPLREGDWAVDCFNPGHFLKVHPNQFGKLASNPAYSFYRPKEPPAAPQREGSETPETDAAEFFIPSQYEEDGIVYADICRGIERQRNEALANLTTAREALEIIQRDCQDYGDPVIRLKSMANFATSVLTQLRDRE